jgi:predicted glycoside hydrolase/deacetylase ChbG (UPF0249 family)
VSVAAARRHIWLCADDYGISRSVNRAVRELILRGRLNATSVMTGAPHFDPEEAAELDKLNSGVTRAAIGLHVTLTGPFRPMSEGFKPLDHDHFLALNKMMRAAMTRRLDPARLIIEVATQIEAFVRAFGRPPDFLDGHQHVQLFPQVRDAVLKVATVAAPRAWIRQCGRPRAAGRRKSHKELVLDVLSLGFRRKARRLGVAFNPAFAGAYDFHREPDFAKVFPRFLAGQPDGGLVMCHPGFVDAELKRLDDLTDQREREFAYFNSDEFPRALSEHGIALTTP